MLDSPSLRDDPQHEAVLRQHFIEQRVKQLTLEQLVLLVGTAPFWDDGTGAVDIWMVFIEQELMMRKTPDEE